MSEEIEYIISVSSAVQPAIPRPKAALTISKLEFYPKKKFIMPACISLTVDNKSKEYGSVRSRNRDICNKPRSGRCCDLFVTSQQLANNSPWPVWNPSSHYPMLTYLDMNGSAQNKGPKQNRYARTWYNPAILDPQRNISRATVRQSVRALENC